MKLTAAPAQDAGAARDLLVAGAVEDIICRVLCLGRSMNEKFAIIAEFLQPALRTRLDHRHQQPALRRVDRHRSLSISHTVRSEGPPSMLLGISDLGMCQGRLDSCLYN